MVDGMRNNGFSLLELSVVLLIIALLVGGVLVGRNLIAAGEIQKQAALLTQFESAVNSFQAKYGTLPGDFKESGVIQRVTAGHYGDGNGYITTNAESAYAWEHLSKAGFIPGNYGGSGNPFTFGGGGCMHTTDCPSTLFNPVIIQWIQSAVGDVWSTVLLNKTKETYRNSTTLMMSHQDLSTAGGITVSQAYGVDLKLDDGVANKGKFQSLNDLKVEGASTVLGTCVEVISFTSFSVNDFEYGDYVKTNTKQDCLPIYVLN